MNQHALVVRDGGKLGAAVVERDSPHLISMFVVGVQALLVHCVPDFDLFVT